MEKSRLSIIVKIVIIMTILLIYACNSSSYEDETKKERLKIANNVHTTQAIVIGIAWPDEDGPFVKGAKLAAMEINNQKAKLLNRELKLIINDKEKVVNSLKLRASQHVAVNVANEFANNPQVVAVIGHRYSKLAVPACYFICEQM